MRRRGRFAAGILAATVLCAVAAPVAAQGDPEGDWREGRRLSVRSCQACHGMDGLSKLPGAPHIAAQPHSYLIDQMRAFRDGRRHNEVMSIAVRDLTDREIVDIAAYYAAIEIEVVRIPGRN